MRARTCASLTMLVLLLFYLLTPVTTEGSYDEPTADALLVIVGNVVDSQNFGQV